MAHKNSIISLPSGYFLQHLLGCIALSISGYGAISRNGEVKSSLVINNMTLNFISTVITSILYFQDITLY